MPPTDARHTTRTTTTREKKTVMWVDGKNGKLPWGAGKVAALAAVPLAGLTLLGGTLWAVPSIEDELAAETRSDLAAAGFDAADFEVDYSYRNGTITGMLPDGATEADVLGAVSYRGIRDLDVDLTPAPDPDPAPEPTAAPTAQPTPEPEPEPTVEAVATGPTEVNATIGADGILLEGEVLSEAQRDTIVAAAEARYGADLVTDELTVTALEEATPGADDRAAALALLISTIPDAVTGTASLDDTRLDFSGTAADAAAAAAIEGALGEVAAVSTSSMIEIAQADVEAQTIALQAELDALQAELSESVTFDTSSAGLSPAAQATLDKVVAAMEAHPLPVVSIEGHTDSRGDEDLNARLSDSRAQQVGSYLVSAGIDPDRLETVGRGESDPIADNTTEAGRAENRRVELVAQGSFAIS